MNKIQALLINMHHKYFNQDIKKKDFCSFSLLNFIQNNNIRLMLKITQPFIKKEKERKCTVNPFFLVLYR